VKFIKDDYGWAILCLQNHNHQFFEIDVRNWEGVLYIYLRVHLTPYVGSFYSGYFRTPADLFALVSEQIQFDKGSWK